MLEGINKKNIIENQEVSIEEFKIKFNMYLYSFSYPINHVV